ncbi:MAG TPA: hypothetical protein VKH34_15585, partial [Vicinamibacterales bacterium]|nr:hypothetical protein [Vicinamibacterales bacterium]
MNSPADPTDNGAALDRVLARAGAIEPAPPLGFVATVMRSVNQAQERMSWWRRWRRSQRATNLLSSRGVDPASNGIAAANRRYAATGVTIMKKVVWSAAAIGAVAIV